MNKIFSRSLVAFCVLLAVCAQNAHAVIVIDGYDPDVNDRFDSSSFIGAALDWSGVGRATFDGGMTYSGWGTMITANHFISANHAHPGAGATLAFWPGNSSTDPAVTRTVTGGQRIGNTDIWIGTLDQAIPNNIAIYDFAPAATIGVGGMGAYEDQLIYTVGVRGTLGFAVGQNRYDSADTTPPILGTFDAIGFIQDLSGDANFVPYETYLQGGDSGAPSFLVDGSELKLTGTHSFITINPVNQSQFLSALDYKTPAASITPMASRQVSFDTFVANYQSDIAAAVPEPSAAVLLAFPLALLVMCRLWPFFYKFRLKLVRI